MRSWIHILLLCAVTVAGKAEAAVYAISVSDADGQPLSGAVIHLDPLDPIAADAAAPAPGIMDQVDRQFSPHILVVQRGADVAFPNSDSIKHHVYSFSEAKTFEIRLYRGSMADPITFDRPGEVELGCNVHDWMLGYIYVVDTPFFARSDTDGTARVEAPPGRYRIGVWHPRIQEDPDGLKLATGPERLEYRIELRSPLLPPYDPEAAGEFDDDY